MEVLKLIGMVIATCLLWLCILGISIGVPLAIVYVGATGVQGTDSIWSQIAIVLVCSFALIEVVPFIISTLFKKA